MRFRVATFPGVAYRRRLRVAREIPAGAIERRVATVPGTRSAFADRSTGGFYIDIAIKRDEAARLGNAGMRWQLDLLEKSTRQAVEFGRQSARSWQSANA